MNSDKYWDGIPIRYWPISLAKAVCEERLNYTTRWQLMLYLVGNGWLPEDAADEILKMGASYFDGDAKRHVANLARDMYTKGSKWTYWDENHAKRMPIGNLHTRGVKSTRKTVTNIVTGWKNHRREGILLPLVNRCGLKCSTTWSGSRQPH